MRSAALHRRHMTASRTVSPGWRLPALASTFAGTVAITVALGCALPPGMAFAKSEKPVAVRGAQSPSLVAPAPASAAPSPLPSGAGAGQGPVEVTADSSLEWHQEQKLYVARGNARATQGSLSVAADTLMARQREKSVQNPAESGKDPQTGGFAGGGSIDKLTADGHVLIAHGNQRISGEHAVYDLDARVVVVTGGNLRYENGDQVVTARDSLEYYDERKIAVARGRATATQKDNKIQADTLSAEFTSSPGADSPQSGSGDSSLSKMTALGHVAVFSGRDVARSDKAVYNAASKVAVLSGRVRITRGDGTQLSGDVGEVDFAAGQSRLLNAGNGGRVRALLSSNAGTGNTGKQRP